MAVGSVNNYFNQGNLYQSNTNYTSAPSYNNFNSSVFTNVSYGNSLSDDLARMGEPQISDIDINSIMNDLFSFDDYLNDPSSFGNDYFSQNFNTNTNIESLKNVYNPDLGNKLANIAAKNATNMNTKGWCARGVNNSLQDANFAHGETRVASAYQEASVLENHKNFKEVSISKDELKNLPAGCIIVWDAYQGNPDGHITITLGDGREASDHISNICILKSSYKVFVPVSTDYTA